jgi:RNA polymerase sigma factor (sigma-70 family)
MDMDSTLERLQNGDEQAWDGEFPRLWEIAFAAARLRGISYEDAEDVAIETIKRLSHRIAGAKSMDDVDKLLWSISRNCAIDLIRRNQADKRPHTISDEQIGPEGDVIKLFELIPSGGPPEISVPAKSDGGINIHEMMSHLPDQSHAADQEKLRKIISEAIAPLPEPDRSIWWDHFWEDSIYEELGTKYGKTPGAVRTLYCRTNAKIVLIITKSKDLMKRLGDFLR